MISTCIMIGVILSCQSGRDYLYPQARQVVGQPTTTRHNYQMLEEAEIRCGKFRATMAWLDCAVPAKR